MTQSDKSHIYPLQENYGTDRPQSANMLVKYEDMKLTKNYNTGRISLAQYFSEGKATAVMEEVKQLSLN